MKIIQIYTDGACSGNPGAGGYLVARGEKGVWAEPLGPGKYPINKYYFRNSEQDQDVIAFLSTRKERQDSAKQHISKVLDEYNVHAVDTLIGDSIFI